MECRKDNVVTPGAQLVHMCTVILYVLIKDVHARQKCNYNICKYKCLTGYGIQDEGVPL